MKREHAPIGARAWSEIDRAARRVLQGHLIGRRLVDVDGPHGWDYSSVGLGRLDLSDTEHIEGVASGLRRSLPLVESRARCELDIWELDNIDRGAEDVDLGPLEDAVRSCARFEDHAIFHGLENASIPGLLESGPNPPVSLDAEPDRFLDALTKALSVAQRNSVEGPFILVLDPSLFQFVATTGDGYPLIRRVASLLGGPVVESELVEGGVLASLRGGDLELILGQDFSIGYESHDATTVRLFVTETFTFRILDPVGLTRLLPSG